MDADLDALLSTLRNGVYTMIIKRQQEQRSIAQNDLMWMWFTCIERETGTPKDDVYMYYCKRFLCKVIEIGNHREKIYNTSSKLTMEEMTEFLNKIKADAATELGITLPLPEDRFFEQFYAQFNY
jgi:hypothetical protein